jgi:hypothetical protein
MDVVYSTAVPPQLDVVTALKDMHLCVVCSHITRYLFFFYCYNISSRRLQHLHCIFGLSQNIICDFRFGSAALSVVVLFVYTHARLRSARDATRKRNTPYTCTFLLWRESTALNGNLLNVKRFNTLFVMFLSSLSGFFAGCSIAGRQLFYHLSLPTYLYAHCSTYSL